MANKAYGAYGKWLTIRHTVHMANKAYGVYGKWLTIRHTVHMENGSYYPHISTSWIKGEVANSNI